MVPISSLWLPILLSAIFVFVASSLLHMALKFHNADYRQLPEEDKLVDALRAARVTAGRVYYFPYAHHKDMNSPEVMEKFKRGPVGLLTVIPSGPPAMGKYLAQWFAYCVGLGVFVAYLTSRTQPPGTPYLEVFRMAGATAFLGYAGSHTQDSIWKGQTWIVTLKHIFDSLVYALLTAGTFGWLWPK
jgi:hypothetical protein